MRLVAGRADVDDVDRFVDWLRTIGAKHDCAVQAFDARYVADEDHLTAAVRAANRAFDRGENVARDRSVEILLYAAGRRQIDQAIEMGVSSGDDVPLVVVVDGTALSGDDASNGDEDGAVGAILERISLDDAVLGDGRDEDRIRAFFDIGDAEIAAATTDLSGLVRERVALLDVEK